MRKKIEFNIVDEKYNLKYPALPANAPVLLDVDISDITAKTKSVSFRCDVPKWIYNVLVGGNADVEKRIERTTLSGLHDRLSKLSDDAIQMYLRGKQKMVRVIRVNFTEKSNERVYDKQSGGWGGLMVCNNFEYCVCERAEKV